MNNSRVTFRSELQLFCELLKNGENPVKRILCYDSITTTPKLRLKESQRCIFFNVSVFGFDEPKPVISLTIPGLQYKLRVYPPIELKTREEVDIIEYQPDKEGYLGWVGINIGSEFIRPPPYMVKKDPIKLEVNFGTPSTPDIDSYDLYIRSFKNAKYDHIAVPTIKMTRNVVWESNNEKFLKKSKKCFVVGPNIKYPESFKYPERFFFIQYCEGDSAIFEDLNSHNEIKKKLILNYALYLRKAPRFKIHQERVNWINNLETRVVKFKPGFCSSKESEDGKFTVTIYYEFIGKDGFKYKYDDILRMFAPVDVFQLRKIVGFTNGFLTRNVHSKSILDIDKDSIVCYVPPFFGARECNVSFVFGYGGNFCTFLPSEDTFLYVEYEDGEEQKMNVDESKPSKGDGRGLFKPNSSPYKESKGGNGFPGDNSNDNDVVMGDSEIGSLFFQLFLQKVFEIESTKKMDEFNFRKVQLIKLVRVIEEYRDKQLGRDIYGMTLLHHAVARGCFYLVRLLLINKYNVNFQDNFGNTPLHYASGYKKYQIEDYLIRNGADKEIKNKYDKSYLDMDGIYVDYEKEELPKQTIEVEPIQEKVWKKVSLGKFIPKFVSPNSPDSVGKISPLLSSKRDSKPQNKIDKLRNASSFLGMLGEMNQRLKDQKSRFTEDELKLFMPFLDHKKYSGRDVYNIFQNKKNFQKLQSESKNVKRIMDTKKNNSFFVSKRDFSAYLKSKISKDDERDSLVDKVFGKFMVVMENFLAVKV